MEYSPKKINMVLYLLEEKDIKVPSQKWEIVPSKLYIVGRSKKEADIAIDDKLLSRRHAELTFYDDDKIKIRDLGSRNGTYINKNRIEPLKDIYFTIKDRLSFGETNNEIIFFDNNNENRQRDSYNEKKSDSNANMEKRSYSNRYANDNYDNYQKERYSNKYQETDKYKSNKSNKSNNFSNKNRSNRSNRDNRSNRLNKDNKSESKSRGGRSRSREQKYQEFQNHNNDIDNEYSFDRYSKEIDRKIEYQRRMMMMGQGMDRENGRNSMFRRSQRYNNNENEDNGSNLNQGDIGFIKSYVSGYLLLNIKL